MGIEASAFVMRRVVEEIPKIKEVVAWHSATGAVVQVEETRNITAELNRVLPENLGGHVLVAVRPLIQDAADTRPKLFWRINTPDLINPVGGKPHWRLRV